MGGCAKNNDKKDGKDGAKDHNKANSTLFLKREASKGFQISPEKKSFYVEFKPVTNTTIISDELLKKHLSYLETSTENGHLDACGAYEQGGYQVIVASSIKEVHDIIKNDPLLSSGHYVAATIRETEKHDLTVGLTEKINMGM